VDAERGRNGRVTFGRGLGFLSVVVAGVALATDSECRTHNPVPGTGPGEGASGELWPAQKDKTLLKTAEDHAGRILYQLQKTGTP